jgi:hypothetical protein
MTSYLIGIVVEVSHLYVPYVSETWCTDRQTDRPVPGRYGLTAARYYVDDVDDFHSATVLLQSREYRSLLSLDNKSVLLPFSRVHVDWYFSSIK